MGVDTEGILNRTIGVLDIKKVLEELVQNELVIEDRGNNYYTVDFTYCGEYRSISIFENYKYDQEIGDIVTLITLSKFGCACEIIKSIVIYFGGYYVEDDCAGEDPVYLKKDSSYIEDSSAKAEKELLKLMVDYDLKLNTKLKIIKLIKENKEKLNELVDKL